MLSYLMPSTKNDVISILCFKDGYSKITSYFSSLYLNMPDNYNKGMTLVKIKSIKSKFILIYDVYATLESDKLTFCKAYFSLDKKSGELELLSVKILKSTDLNC